MGLREKLNKSINNSCLLKKIERVIIIISVINKKSFHNHNYKSKPPIFNKGKSNLYPIIDIISKLLALKKFINKIDFIWLNKIKINTFQNPLTK